VLILGNRQGKSFKGVKLFELVVGLIVGGTAGVAGTWFALKNTVERALAAKNVDYKDRWQEAVKLLGSEGNLTDEQVQRITGEEALHLEPEAAISRHVQRRPARCGNCPRRSGFAATR
jgi:hypothetical protein